MTGAPEDVVGMVAEREEARRRRDFAAADTLRARILAAGFALTDTPEGPVLVAAAPAAASSRVRRRPADVEGLLDRPTVFEASVQWLVQGWPEDVVRGMEAFRRHSGEHSLQHVVVDVTGEDRAWPGGSDVVPLLVGTGWAEARNAGLVRSLGRMVLVMDGSAEIQGDVVAPLAAALADATIGITGPCGIVTEDLHEFRKSAGPEVDAIEGYLMALRREQVVAGLRFDRGFKFYRSADIELSFQIKNQGLRAIVTDVPLTIHEHRMWATTPEAERERLSKRNFYRFLDRWRGRSDLTVAGGREN